ncbi:MAG TPA: hypothetical protein VLO11_00090 [Luteolibacter sp.]|nr:hypothetical protein [Luteolibacter sp.]
MRTSAWQRHAGDSPAASSRRAKTPDLSVDDLVAIYEKDGATAALDAAKALTGSQRDSKLSFILSYLARIDPEFVANELLNSGLNVHHHGFVVNAVLHEWKDGKKALAWADTKLTGESRLRAVAKALGILVRTDPQAALAHLDTLPESNSRRQAISDLFNAWGRHDPQAALRHAAQLPPDEVESATGSVLRSWVRTHPEEAAAWLKACESQSPDHLRDVFLAWPEDDKTSAQAWFDSLPESAAKIEAKAGIEQMKAAPKRITTVCGPAPAPDESWKTKNVSEMKVEDLRNWAYQDKAGARRFLEKSPDNPALSEMVITVAACMASDESPQAVFDWALKLSPGLQADALRLAVIAWSGKDPAAAAEKILSIPADRRGPLALAIADNWTRRDPAAGAAWVANCSEPNQPALVVKVLEQWTAMEPQQAYEWLGTLPAGAARDEGISLMIRREARHDPASLQPWVDQISQPELKKEMGAFLQSWR